MGSVSILPHAEFGPPTVETGEENFEQIGLVPYDLEMVCNATLHNSLMSHLIF